MFEIRRILCPVDLSDASRHALDHASALAGRYSASLTVLHVYQPIYMPVPAPAIAGVSSTNIFNPADEERLRQQVQAFVTDQKPGNVPYDIVIESGPPAVRIVEQAAKLQASIVVIGTHGVSGFEHLMVGSVTEKVLRKAPCPVLTVPPRAEATSKLPVKRLLCPVDFSDASISAARWAMRLAKQLDGRVTLVHVLEGPEEDEPVISRSFNVPEYRRLRQVDAESRLAALVPEDLREWCAPVQVAHGKPYREVLRLADAEGVDLIVMGVHGRNPIDLALFGSTTNHVVRRARCPVLTLRPDANGGNTSRGEASEKMSVSS
jgi:nucleotide-binding universal stress UspA family protein